MEFQHFSELTPTNKHDWKIKVRVAKKWKERSKDNSTVYGIHLILIDGAVSNNSFFATLHGMDRLSQPYIYVYLTKTYKFLFETASSYACLDWI